MMSISPDLSAPVVPQGPWSLFLDIDGTLLEHAAHPDAVVVSDDLRTLLVRLEAQLDGALAFITGNQDEFGDESNVLKIEKVIPGKSKGIVFIGPLKAGEYPFVGEYNEKTAKGVVVAK